MKGGISSVIVLKYFRKFLVTLLFSIGKAYWLSSNKWNVMEVMLCDF